VSALARLNLKPEWTASIPIASRLDGINRVQVVDHEQLFVQTKNGALYSIDAKTGRELWKFLYPSKLSEGYALAVNEQYVYSVNVSKLYCHQRYTGVVEFEVPLPELPAAGPEVDDEVLFVPFNTNKLASYELPPSYRTSSKGKQDAKDRGILKSNPADSVVERNQSRNTTQFSKDPPIDGFNLPPNYFDVTELSTAGNATPSLTALQSVVPPYTTGGLNKVVSISTLPSLKQPYSLKPDYMQFNQISPSIAVIPPSVARLYELSNLRPPPFTPKLRWIVRTPGKILGEPIFVAPTSTRQGRIWVATESAQLQEVARDRDDGDVQQLTWRINDAPSGPMAGPAIITKDITLGVLCLRSGEVLGIDLNAGTSESPRYEFRANVPGTLNYPPVVAADGVYVSGDNAGVSRININSGQVDWRTPSSVDRLLAITGDCVYALDHQGTLHQFAKGLVNDRGSRTARPLATLPMPAYTKAVSNDRTNRVYLATGTGELLCLRDNSPASLKIQSILPPVQEPTKPTVAEPLTEPPTPEPAKPVEPVKPKDEKN